MLYELAPLDHYNKRNPSFLELYSVSALGIRNGLIQCNIDAPPHYPHMLNVPSQSVLTQLQCSAQLFLQQQFLARPAAGNVGSNRCISSLGVNDLSNKVALPGGSSNRNSAASPWSQYTSQQGTNCSARVSSRGSDPQFGEGSNVHTIRSHKRQLDQHQTLNSSKRGRRK